MSEYTVLYKGFRVPLPKTYIEGDHRIFVTATSEYYLITIHHNLDSRRGVYQKKDIHKLDFAQLDSIEGEENIEWASVLDLNVSESIQHTPPDFRDRVTRNPNQDIRNLSANNCFESEINKLINSNFANVITKKVDEEAKIYIFDPETKQKNTENKIKDILLLGPKNVTQSIEFEVDEIDLKMEEENCETDTKKITLSELPGGLGLTAEELSGYDVVSGLIFLR